jgi:type II secretion system protein N
MAILPQKKGVRWLALIGYVLFAMVTFVAALVVTFPMERLAKQAADLVSSRSDWKVAVAGAGWAPPTGLRLNQIVATPPQGGPLMVEDVLLRLYPKRLKQGKLALDHELGIYGGLFTGHLVVQGPKTEPGYEWKGAISGAKLDRVPLPPPGVPPAPWSEGLALAGLISADGAMGWRGGQVLRGNGELNIQLADLVIELAKTPIGALTLPIGQVDGRFKWQRGRVDVTDLRIQGDLVQARGSGRLIVGNSPRNTRIDLRLTGDLGDQFPMAEVLGPLLKTGGKPVTITLKGTVAAPVLYINGKTLDRLMLGR